MACPLCKPTRSGTRACLKNNEAVKQKPPPNAGAFLDEMAQKCKKKGDLLSQMLMVHANEGGTKSNLTAPAGPDRGEKA